jgi:hypothetical protein
MVAKSKVTKLKRFIIIFGSKGGIGKTAYARFLLSEFTRLNLNYSAYDADKENPDLYRYYKDVGTGVKLVDFLAVDGAGKVLEEMNTAAPDIILLDLPAASGDGTRSIFEQFALLETAQELGYRITLVCVINTDNAVLGSIKTMAQFCGDKIDYTIVRNKCWSKDNTFEMWDNSQLKPQIITELKGLEIEMAALDPSAFLALSKHKTPYHLADKVTVGFAPSLLVKGFLIGSRAGFEQAKEYWGIG